MRLYTFTNLYLSSIQNGIQTGHVIHEMFVKYAPKFIHDSNVNLTHDSEMYDMIYDWAENHKTMILLNGGYSDNLRELMLRFGQNENPFPWEYFREGQDALDSALTCVGIILPEKIYESAAYIRSLPFHKKTEELSNIESFGNIELNLKGKEVTFELSKWEFDLVNELNNYRLAQ